MQTEILEKSVRSFHEAIVKVIRGSSGDDIGCLGLLLRMTKIPEGHDEILKAIDETWGRRLFWGDEVAQIKEGVMKQKEIAEKAIILRKPDLNFNKILCESEHLTSLLKDQKLQSTVWWQSVIKSLCSLHRMSLPMEALFQNE